MAIRVPNLGTGNGQTGDNELKIRSDYNHNFTDPTNAASRLVGTANNQIPSSQDAYKAAYGQNDGYLPSSSSADCNSFDVGTRYLVGIGNANTPPADDDTFYFIETIANYGSTSKLQRAWGYLSGVIFTRVEKDGVWTAWQHASTSKYIFNSTSAGGANLYMTTAGRIYRSTSSERYKNIIAPLELDGEAYANAMQLAPIVYRSTADADNPNYHFYSFSAEALGAYDPAFTLWRETETVTDADGITTEQPLDERVAEGINLNAIVAFLHATNIKQGKLIADLESRLSALEPQTEV